MTSESADLARRVLQPFWRGVVAYRVLALGYAGALVWSNFWHYRVPGAAVVVLGGMTVWTVVTSLGYLSARRSPVPLAWSDLGVSLVAVVGTLWVETPERIAAGAPVLPTVWVAGAPIALALASGAVSGLVGALVLQAVVVAVRGRLGPVELTDLLLMVAASVAVGYAATLLRRSADRLREAIELRAAVAERERLARSIHDGVLQVLARVRRRGTELGGPAAELGALAGEQEIALRTLVTSGPPAKRSLGQLDLAGALAGLASPTVTVSTPADAVELPAHTVNEVVAAVRAALANVREHVGADEPAWILLEDGDERVVVSVRDNGPGIADGRLAEAESAGRMGVARSIRGRVEDVGGTVALLTGPGLGCEWTFELPVGTR